MNTADEKSGMGQEVVELYSRQHANMRCKKSIQSSVFGSVLH